MSGKVDLRMRVNAGRHPHVFAWLQTIERGHWAARLLDELEHRLRCDGDGGSAGGSARLAEARAPSPANAMVIAEETAPLGDLAAMGDVFFRRAPS
ncbi:hypothetical protein CKO23_20500 [Thiocystis violacea]|nr:hypothetical protein [Thiocystis violacea]